MSYLTQGGKLYLTHVSRHSYPGPRARHRGGGVPQYFTFLTLCLWALHGKNRLETAFAPPPQPSGRDGAFAQGGGLFYSG